MRDDNNDNNVNNVGGAKRPFAMCSSFCRSALPQDQVITSHHHHHHQNHHNCLFQICWFGINMKWSPTFEMLLSLPYLSFFVVFFNFPQILQRLSEPQEGGREAWPPGICLLIYLLMWTFQYLIIYWIKMKTVHGLWTYHLPQNWVFYWICQGSSSDHSRARQKGCWDHRQPGEVTRANEDDQHDGSDADGDNADDDGGSDGGTQL